MTPAELHDFFLASAGVAGALVGLLFVAISVSQDRLTADADSHMHRVRASASLTSFTNALAVSMFALIPGDQMGWVALDVAIVGLLFVVSSLLLLSRAHQLRWRHARDAIFLIGLAAVFVYQLIEGIRLLHAPADPHPLIVIAVLVIVCFLIGIARAWELIGGPTIGIGHQVGELLHEQRVQTADTHRAAEGHRPEAQGR